MCFTAELVVSLTRMVIVVTRSSAIEQSHRWRVHGNNPTLLPLIRCKAEPALLDGANTISLIVDRQPGVAAIYPYVLRIDRNRFDNFKDVSK